MDYQNGIIPMAANPEKLLAGARQAIDLIRSHGGTICYVRVGFADAHEISGSMGKRVGGPAAALEQRPRSTIRARSRLQFDDGAIAKCPVIAGGS